MGKKYLGNRSYFIWSVVLASVFIFSALPYYTITTTAFLSIYWNYGETQLRMYVIFIVMSSLGAISTFHKRKSFIDVLINLIHPLNVLLSFKIARTFTALFFVYELILLILIFKKSYTFSSHNLRMPSGRDRLKLTYYDFRKRSAVSLILILAPLAVIALKVESISNSSIRNSILLSREAAGEANNETESLIPVDKKEWDAYSVEERFEKVCSDTRYFLRKLGIQDSVDLTISAVDELTDGLYGYYDANTNTISFNVFLLSSADYETVLKTAAHEAFHVHDYMLVQDLDKMEECDINSELSYFGEAKEIKKAVEKYTVDQSLDYESYYENLLEKRAREYSEKIIEELQYS